MSRVFGAGMPYGPPPLPTPPPINGTPVTTKKCEHCTCKPAVPLRELGIFGYAVVFCSVDCAARQAVDAFLDRHEYVNCTFCGKPCDHFHSCYVCDEAYRLVDELHDIADLLADPLRKEVGG